jgi:hypothetical protein
MEKAYQQALNLFIPCNTCNKQNPAKSRNAMTIT